MSAATPNGTPAVAFDGDDDLFTTTTNMVLPKTHTMLVVAIDTNSVDGHVLWWQGPGSNLGSAADDTQGPALQLSLSSGDRFYVRNYNTWPQANWAGWNVMPTDDWELYTVNALTNDVVGYADGAYKELNFTDNPWPPDDAAFATNKGAFLMGKHKGGTSQYFEGAIAEVVVFTTNLNAVERQLVENYLSAKHMTNALTAGDHYAGDTAVNGDYDHDVFGIGRVDADNEVTEAGTAGLGFEENGTTLDNGDWLLAGHRVSVNWRSTEDLPAGIAQRWKRVWYIDKTGSLDVDMVFDYSDAGLSAPAGGTDFELLYSASEDPYSFTKKSIAESVAGDTVTFTVNDADLADGYYTLGSDEPAPTAPAITPVTGGTGPGGLGNTNGTSALEVWLKADEISSLANGEEVTTHWRDASGYGNHSQPDPGHPSGSLGGNPTYTAAGTPNGTPSVTFDGSDDLFLTTDNMALPKTHTLFSVVINNDTAANYYGYVMWWQAPGSTLGGTSDDLNGPAFSVSRNGPGSFFVRGYGDGSINHFSDMPTTNWQVYTVNAVSDNVVGYAGGDSVNLGFTENPWPPDDSAYATNTGAFLLGKHRGNAAQYLEGEIAEIVVFTTNLNSVERSLVENYLSAKLMTNALSRGDHYAGDTAANGDYDHDVFGIGSLGGTAAVTNSGAAGFGLAERGIGDPLSSGEWVLAGHNGGANTLVSTGDNGVQWSRSWYVDVTGSAAALLSFDYSDGGVAFTAGGSHRLLYRAAEGDTWTVLVQSATVDGDTISFVVEASALDDGYYTVARYPAGTVVSIR
jgi:hypothetical protein